MDTAHDDTTSGPDEDIEGTAGEGLDAVAGPDGEPTPDQEAAAERSAADVDVESVKAHEEEMNERGATVKGEGEIE
jgi:hypothetical protein